MLYQSICCNVMNIIVMGRHGSVCATFMHLAVDGSASRACMVMEVLVTLTWRHVWRMTVKPWSTGMKYLKHRAMRKCATIKASKASRHIGR